MTDENKNSDPKLDGHPAMRGFHPPVRDWFASAFPGPTRPQELGWPVIQSGEHTLLLSPTGSGKTLAAFLVSIDHVMFEPVPDPLNRCRVLYISPLKALAVDVEKNLREPIHGIAYFAKKMDVPIHSPEIALRTGDTPSRERAAFLRRPADFLITTPESLFLMLTSQARERLRSIRWVILDEIHAIVNTKRGSHLALSLERLEEIVEKPFQRIGLSATQRPLEEVARFLGGFHTIAGKREEGRGKRREIEPDFRHPTPYTLHPAPRPVQIVDAGRGKQLEIRVMVPASDMIPENSGPADPKSPPSIWAGIHPLILEQINSHRSTLIFVNSRRMAERLAAALNDLAGSEVVHAHHGSLAREKRLLIEEELKSGRLPAIVATSSLELGIDMGAIDLVIQVEAAPSVSSALQRVGRAGHQVGETSSGIFLPKFRGDLLACAALTTRMLRGEVEPMHYPRNPLDILAQQIVAMVSVEDWRIEKLEAVVRRSAPFVDLPQQLFLEVLDMLSGKYPSDEFASLKPRITWDRNSGILSARPSAKGVAIANAGSIPDRGHYGVYLAGTPDAPVSAGMRGAKSRLGELDEEMVFESKVGDVFLLGASSWRIEEITNDKVFVSPAPARGGKMPFWHGDRAGRPAEFGRAIGALSREISSLPPAHAIDRLVNEHFLDETAARSLVEYLNEQKLKGILPDDRTFVVETYRDENNEWRMCLLSPYGTQVHAPLAMAVAARIFDRTGNEADILWMDDGIVVRMPDTELPPDPTLFFPEPEEVTELIIRQLGSGGGGARSLTMGAPVNTLFASRFREASARALLLPRRYPGKRSPLWQQRKRAADLLRVTAEYGSFPMVLETFREILQDDFDMPSLISLLEEVRSREMRVVNISNPVPSPFAASLFFHYIANFMYEGDTPTAERRAQALQVDAAQLRSLLGTTELRALLNPEAIHDWERHLQHLTPERAAHHPDGLHDMLLDIGDLTEAEIRARIAFPEDVKTFIDTLVESERIVSITLGGEMRYYAVEDVSRYRDGLGVRLPNNIHASLLVPVKDPLGDLISRYARSHGPFTAQEAASRFGTGIGPVSTVLQGMASRGKVVEGEFRPEGDQHEWCDAGVLRAVRQMSLQQLRREVEPVEESALGRLFIDWQGVDVERARDILQVIEQLQGVDLPASVFESQILSRRLPDYRPEDLDMLFSSGELVWVANRSKGSHDGWIRLYLTETLSLLLDPVETVMPGDLHESIREYLGRRGASFYPQIVSTIGVFPASILETLWELVWAGEVTNDTLQPLRSLIQQGDPVRERKVANLKRSGRASIQGRRSSPPEASGRWSLVRDFMEGEPSPTDKIIARVRQLLARYGIVTREIVQASGLSGGFSAAYPVLRTMEEAGRIRRGYFVSGLGALQFALPGALERLRALRDPPENTNSIILAASDPANPYGVALPWPARTGKRPARTIGARVILVDGAAAGWLSPDEKNLLTFQDSEDEANKKRMAEAMANALSDEVDGIHRRAFYIETVDESERASEPLHTALLNAGFTHRDSGYQKRQ